MRRLALPGGFIGWAILRRNFNQQSGSYNSDAMKEELARIAGGLFRGELLVAECVVLFFLTAGLVQAAGQSWHEQ